MKRRKDMVNLIIQIVYLLLFIFSIIKCNKTKDADLKMCWALSGVLWVLLMVINALVTAALSKGM
jgi:hypothetical protein